MAEIIDVVMRLTDQVSDRLTHIRREMEQTARGNVRLGNTVQGVGRSLGSVANTMMPIAAGITAIGTVGAKSFMDFDAQITAAAVKAGATAEELNAMRDAAGKFGAQFPITAREAAEGMDRLAAGGFNATQAIGAMPGIIEAAVASGEDLGATSDVVTSALSIWNLTTGDIAANTTHVADVIQAAANASKLGMQDFGLAMQYAGAPAAALGVSIEELGTAMGIMSNKGIEASAIGTSLRATFSRLARPPKEAAAALASLGISSADLYKRRTAALSGLLARLTSFANEWQGCQIWNRFQRPRQSRVATHIVVYSRLLARLRKHISRWRTPFKTVPGVRMPRFSRCRTHSKARWIRLLVLLRLWE